MNSILINNYKDGSKTETKMTRYINERKDKIESIEKNMSSQTSEMSEFHKRLFARENKMKFNKQESRTYAAKIADDLTAVRYKLKRLDCFPSITKGNSYGQTVFDRIALVDQKIGDCIDELHTAMSYYADKEVDDIGTPDTF